MPARVLTVLVVDDQPAVADATAELLAARGHQARAVYGGAEAVVAASVDRPDVILVDLGMPGMDGFAAAPWLRAQVPGVALVAITGLAWADVHERCAAAGFDTLLLKPVAVADLERVLGSVRRSGATEEKVGNEADARTVQGTPQE